VLGKPGIVEGLIVLGTIRPLCLLLHAGGRRTAMTALSFGCLSSPTIRSISEVLAENNFPGRA